MEPVDRILQETNSSKYYIEYNGFYFNHIAPGLIALHKLGATEGRLYQFIKFYEARLECPSSHHLQTEAMQNEENIASLLGQRRKFYPLLEYYEKLSNDTHRGSVKDLIQEEFPKLSQGLVCMALHGLIQLGYGCGIQNPKVICEGLAYIHHSYVPLVSPTLEVEISAFGSGARDIVELLGNIKEDTSLREEMLQGSTSKYWVDMQMSYFERRAGALFMNSGTKLLQYASQVKLPYERKEEFDSVATETICDWLIDSAIFVYAKSKVPNDFFLLHGVTGAWSFKQILMMMENEMEIKKAILIFLCALFADYMVEDGPDLTKETDTTNTIDQTFWDKKIKDVMTQDYDEHIVKLIQVTYERWQKNKKNGYIYATAANDAVTFEPVDLGIDD